MEKFNWTVRVYYEDTDAGGVVFYANYLKYFERARTEMLRFAGFEQDVLANEQGIVFVVRQVQVDYLKPARFNELLQVTSRVAEAKKTSFVCAQEVIRGAELLCVGSVRIVCVDARTLRPRAIPSKIMEHIS